MEGILKIKPNYLIGSILILEIVLQLCGENYNFKPLYSSIYLIIIGSIIAISGIMLHIFCHRYHIEGHKTSDSIDTIVTSGTFSKIRHPMYLSIIMISWGLYIAWNFIVTLPIPIFLALLVLFIAKKEEQYLLKKTGSKYKEYQNSVRWMFFPGIF